MVQWKYLGSELISPHKRVMHFCYREKGLTHLESFITECEMQESYYLLEKEENEKMIGNFMND